MSKKPVGGTINSRDSLDKTDESNPSPLDNLGELPRSYGSDSIFLVAQEPHWLFTYWDLDISLHPGGKTFLRTTTDADVIDSEIEVPFETRNWYIPVKTAGASYTVEIGFYRGTQWNTLARSATVSTPADRMSGSQDFDYATLPLHISFQRLMENIQTAINDGETLIQALARLQKDGRLLAMGPNPGLPKGSDEYIVLEALLGQNLLTEMSSNSSSSEELSSRIQAHLEERLNSAQSSELLARSQWSPAESSLFSALTSLTGSASWDTPALASWVNAALTSWAAAGPSSWAAGAESSGASSGVPSSWTPQMLSSWLQAATSSFSGAAPTSWSQAALSSWSHAETSSWGGSENVGSFGFAKREFFMHVNAEVIFYGGTHPQAKVTIGGKPVTLNPDGTFRHHFIFPDGAYEIPIVATSPDGVETRSATLRLDRATGRVGEVGHTSQPPLPAPMGALA